MADPRADSPGFLARWSRLKQAERARTVRDAEAPPAAQPEDPVEDLPPIETLTKDSDFRPFMQTGVPDELRNQALRKLWSSDPVYANLDGLLEYGEDFAEPFRGAGIVATVYRVLEGMPDPAKPAAEPGEEEGSPETAATADPANPDNDAAPVRPPPSMPAEEAGGDEEPHARGSRSPRE